MNNRIAALCNYGSPAARKRRAGGIARANQCVIEFIESAPLSQIDRKKICHLNAERLFGLSPDWATTPAETASASADARRKAIA